MKKATKAEAEKAAAKKAEEAAKQVVELTPPEGAIEVDSGDVDVIIKLDPGDTIVGDYYGYKEVKNKTFNTLDRLHKLVVDGEKCGLWGTQTLDGALDKIKVGERVWIGYAGKRPLASGNDMHDFRVARIK